MQCRDFVNIHDVVKANLLVLNDESANYRVFNVGGGKAYTVADFAETVRAEISRYKTDELQPAVFPNLYRFGDTRNACSDISQIRGLGWEPAHTPKDSVKEYVEWLYEQDNVEDILAYAMKIMKNTNVVRPVTK